MLRVYISCNHRRGRNLDLPLLMQSVSITTNVNVVSSNPAHGEVYSIQHYVIKFVSDLRQVNCFLHVLWFPPPIKIDRHHINDNFFESGVKHNNPFTL